MCQSDYLYWFNRACFACQAGNFRDSLESLRKGFTLSDRNHAQAFLDHDLESLWNWMGVTVLTDELAETLIHPIWLKAMETHLSTSMEIELSLAMKSAVPEKYRRFLEPMCLSLRTGPKISAGEYQGYLKWQKAFARPRVDALQRAYDRARDYIVSRQPDFASHQAQIGNFTASRYHILHFLASQPQDFSHVAFLRNLGMGYLLDDVEPAIREDPSFVRKIESVAFTRLRSEEDTQVFDEIGAKVRETVLFQIRLAGCHRHFGRESLAIPHYINGLTRWPDDAVCYSGLVDAYARLGRWEEARLCFRAAPTHYRQFRRYGVHLQQIKEESVEVEKGAEVLNFLGQRDLGGLLLDPGVSNKQGPQ
jgi:pentatricopeptide repeat protein